MDRIRSRLSYSNVVSTLCLFLLLGGGAYAAVKLPRNSVGTKQLKNNAVNGKKVADHSLSGADIGGPVDSVSSAAEAAHAKSADHAGTADQASNAAQLAGAPPSSFFPSADVSRFDREVEVTAEGSHEFPLLSIGPLNLKLACNKASGNLTIALLATSSASNPSAFVEFNTSTGHSEGEEVPLTVVEELLVRTDSSLGESGAGEAVYRDSNTTIAMPFGYSVSHLFGTCRVTGVALQS